MCFEGVLFGGPTRHLIRFYMRKNQQNNERVCFDRLKFTSNNQTLILLFFLPNKQKIGYLLLVSCAIKTKKECRSKRGV